MLRKLIPRDHLWNSISNTHAYKSWAHKYECINSGLLRYSNALLPLKNLCVLIIDGESHSFLYVLTPSPCNKVSCLAKFGCLLTFSITKVFGPEIYLIWQSHNIFDQLGSKTVKAHRMSEDLKLKPTLFALLILPKWEGSNWLQIWSYPCHFAIQQGWYRNSNRY